MQRGLALLGFALASLLVLKSFVVPSALLTASDPMKAKISIYGLHIAGANEMRSFPAELIPLP
jgi:hypothetical protein